MKARLTSTCCVSGGSKVPLNAHLSGGGAERNRTTHTHTLPHRRKVDADCMHIGALVKKRQSFSGITGNFTAASELSLSRVVRLASQKLGSIRNASLLSRV